MHLGLGWDLEWHTRVLNPTLPLQQAEILKSSVKPVCHFCFVPGHTVQVHPASHRLRNKKETLDAREPQAFESAQFIVSDMFLVLHVCPKH